MKVSRTSFALLPLALGLLLPGTAIAMAALPPPPIDAGGDDLFLIQASIAPNVILLMDNSESMGHMEWHPAFDQALLPTCAAFTDGTDYIAADLLTTYGSNNQPDGPATECGNTRTLYDPAKNDAKTDEALYSGRYLNWYFSDAADPYVNDIETAISTGPGCKGQEHIDVYRRTRFQASKQVILDTLCVAESKNVRFGLASFREAADPAAEDPNGGYVLADLGRSNPNHANELESEIKNSTSNDGSPDGADETPLSEALFQIYTYWMSRVTADLPTSDQNGDSVFSTFPRYQYDKSGVWQSGAAQWFEDPMLYECEKAFVVIVTDGLPTRDDFDADPATTAYGYADFLDLIGNYHADAETEDPSAADEATFYLDDIAKYMFEKDFRPDMTGDQTIDTYTVGFATDAATDAFLDRTALLGNGLSFKAKDGEELASHLVAALNDIIEKSASFTSATVPSVRTSNGVSFIQSYFIPRSSGAFWEGHVRAWEIDAAGKILDKNGVCALDDPAAPVECNNGAFLSTAEYHWDAAEEVPQPDLLLPDPRTLYVSKSGVTSGAVPPAFTQANLAAADLLVDLFTAPPAHAPNPILYSLTGSTATSEEGLADEIVAAARGCFFGTGVSANVASPVACQARPFRLGDVFHSGAVFVREPTAFINELSYQNFKTHYAERDRIFYAGTNAGFLESIHAGDFVSGAYTFGTGEEIFGFMPWESRLNIKNLPIDAAASRHHYVDGDVNSADWWRHPGVSTPPTSKAPDGREWRTALVGGLREGGHHFYALDITHPDTLPVTPSDAADGGAPLPFPAYLWEFPTEADVPGDLPFMGESWSKPIIAKVKLVDSNDPLKVVERWVAIVTGGYDPASDPNPDDVTGLVSSYDASAAVHAVRGRGIYILEMKTGAVLAELKFGAPVGHQADMKYATVATPSVLDLNFDGFADVIYASDMGGQVLKWVITADGEDRVNDGSGLRTQPAWPSKVFFRATPQTLGGTGNTYYKNLFFSPAAAFAHGKLYVAFGSGERRNLSFPGVAADNGENNAFYVVIDPDPYEQFGNLGVTFDESDLTDFTGSESAASFGITQGFYFTVDDGEKFVTNTTIFSGDIIAASFKPTSSPNPCLSRGDGTLYIFDLVTGEGHFTDGSNNPTRGLSIGGGLPTDPKVSVGVGGSDSKVIIEKSGAEIEIIDEDDVNLGSGSLYWRERL